MRSSTIALPGGPATALLAEVYGWRGACLAWAGLHLLLGLPLMLSPPRTPQPALPVAAAAAALPEVRVLSYNEITQDTAIESVGIAAQLLFANKLLERFHVGVDFLQIVDASMDPDTSVTRTSRQSATSISRPPNAGASRRWSSIGISQRRPYTATAAPFTQGSIPPKLSFAGRASRSMSSRSWSVKRASFVTAKSSGDSTRTSMSFLSTPATAMERESR